MLIKTYKRKKFSPVVQSTEWRHLSSPWPLVTLCIGSDIERSYVTSSNKIEFSTGMNYNADFCSNSYIRMQD